MNYIDLHTHQNYNPEIIQICNVFAQNAGKNSVKGFFSVGLHPWHFAEVNLESCFENIEQSTSNKNMLAVGECGLDKVIQTDFSLQEQYFRRQAEIAEKAHKPLIIHCVRAYPDIIKLKKEIKSSVPWIIHGFNANKETIRQLLNHGFYFSVGENLLKDDPKIEIFRMIPIGRLFLETDNSEISIQKIYFFAAQMLEMTVGELSGIISNNFKMLFGDDRLVTKDSATS